MDYLEKIKEQENIMSGLFTRMDVDRNLLYLKKYVLTDSKGKAIPDIVNVTLNKPAVFAANVISSLNSTSQQTVVESDDRGLDTHKIEDFQDFALNSANMRLQKRGLPLLNQFTDSQLCIRGRAARRVLFRMENGIVIPDVMSWDTRFMTYEMGEDGLAWAAYKTKRSRAQIEAEYQYSVKGKIAEVLDIWDLSHNEIWIDDNKVKEQVHSYGYTPVVLSIVSLGYGDILLDEDRMQYEGESIFFLCRDIIPELNRLVSILQTLNMKSVKPPMKFKSTGGTRAEPPDYDDATDMGTITALEPQGDIVPIDYGDARRAATMAYNMMESAMQEGSLTNIDLGNLQFPLSAVALTEIGEGRDRVFLPRLQAKALLNQKTAEMITQQIIQMGVPSVELGTLGHKRSFKVAKLEGQYETTYKYFIKSPKIDIARMAVATQAERYYDPEYILEHVLQVEDPKEVMRKRYFYMAEKIDPLILRHRVIMNMLDLAEDGDDDAAREAKIMAASMGMSLQQIRQGELPPPPAPEGAAKPGIPLLGKGGEIRPVPSSAKKAAELKQTPEEGTEEG